MSVLNDLKRPTPASVIQYRVGSIYDKDNGKATVLSYVDARYVQDTLDSVVGPENWESRFYEAKGALFCEITINIDGVKISKSDCGTESDIAPAKGEASDAFKRAAVMFGIGRDLYSSETYFADLEKRGSKWVLPRDWKPNKTADTTPISPPAPPEIDLKDQEVSNPLFEEAKKKFGEKASNSDDWDGNEVIKFGKYKNDTGDPSKDMTWGKVEGVSYFEWLLKNANKDWIKEKATLELKRRVISV